ncbi:RNaseH domain-containing protein [Kitasatospora sp. NPDC087315]|uniref:RNaseH domain-containing protein n=1 Tax=Kitasatospora sp. NPDC087315 TaxID=3364069 RepID=UPI0037F6A66C
MGRRATERDLTAHTTAIHCTTDLLKGMEALVWEFDDDTRNEWRGLQKTARANAKAIRDQREEDVFLVPYSIVVTVLQQLTDGYVHLDKYLRYMVSLTEIPPKTLAKVFTFLEGIVRKIPLDEVPFQVESRLATLIAATTARRLPLAEHILATGDEGVVNPPSWAYDAVKWHIAKRLSAVPLIDQQMEGVTEKYVDKKGETKERIIDWQAAKDEGTRAEVHYRPANDGSLVAWDHPIGPTFAGRGHPIKAEDITRDWPTDESSSRLQYAMSRMTVKMATYTAVDHPIINTDAHVRRVNNALIFSRTALVDQGTGRPLLKVTLDGRGLRQANSYAMEILAKLDADRTALNAVENRVERERTLWNTRDENGKRPTLLTPAPGPVRPVVPTPPKWFAVGTGAGLYHLGLLRDQIERAFDGTARLLELKSKGSVFSPRPFETISASEKAARKKDNRYIDLVGLPDPAGIQRSIEAAGYKTLRILCLYYEAPTRMRMLHGLAHSYGLDPSDIDRSVDGDRIALAPGVEVVFHYAKDLLAHGPVTTRTADTRAVVDAYGEPGVMLAAWCETERPVAGEEHKQLKSSEVERALEDSDAKFQTRRALAATLTPSQYLIGRQSDSVKGDQVLTVPKKPYDDHRVYMGLLDLYRSCGIIDARFEEALYGPDDPYSIPRMAWCGVHIRKQATDRRFRGEPKRIVTASVIIPPDTPEGAWRMLGWSNLSPVWEHYPTAQARFHAANYPLHRADGDNEIQRWTQAGHDVKLALQDLADELDDLPYALIIDGSACRRMWPGLNNNRQGKQPDPTDSRPWLPSTGLPAHAAPVSVIRLNCNQEEMPRLAYVTEKLKSGKEKTLKTSSDLYFPAERTEGHPWFLYTEPRNYGKKRHGQYKTRWRAEPGHASESADERKENELNAPWYAMSTREITPMCTNSAYQREHLAVAAARLSHQALAWSDRTRYAAPQHAALQMDLDHPQYRRSAPTDPESLKVIADAMTGNDSTGS